MSGRNALRKSSLAKCAGSILCSVTVLGSLGSQAKTPWVAAENQDWVAYDHSLEIEPGGIFDFSFLIDAPAGKYGNLVATPAGHFEFSGRSGSPVRFWGVNLVSSAAFLSKEDADRLAERLARSGYNAVRLHHIDGPLVSREGKSFTLDPVRIDQLDYLFSALKKQGIYLNIDLYSNRGFTPDELKSFGIAPLKVDSSYAKYLFKGIVPISDAAFESWSQYAKDLLTHRNPYTGLTWAEDPALIGICPINEDSPFARVKYKELKPLYEAAFEKLRVSPDNKTAIPPDETEAQRQFAFNRFVYEACIRSDARMYSFLRSLGVKALLSGSNHRTSEGLTFVREYYDYVDNHQYWDHPRFPEKSWQLPYQFTQLDAIMGRLASGEEESDKPKAVGVDGGAAWMPRAMMPTRVFGKPFTLTEFNFVRPNQYRAEGGVIMPAYASLQDWDALYNFQYAMAAESAIRGGVDNPFSLACDPIGLLADRVSALIFRRGDVAKAAGAVGYSVQPDEAFSEIGREFPEAFSRLGLVTRIGSHTGPPPKVMEEQKLSAMVGEVDQKAAPKIYPADPDLASSLQRDGLLPEHSTNAAETLFISDTGQIEMKTDVGTMKVITPLSELFVLPPSAQLEGKSVSVKNGAVFGTVCVVSADGRALSKSSRILVTHLTNAMPTKMSFADQDGKLLTGWGNFPQLVQKGAVHIALQLDDGANYKAWAVDTTGKRQYEVPLRKTENGWTFTAETANEKGSQLAYEIERSTGE